MVSPSMRLLRSLAETINGNGGDTVESCIQRHAIRARVGACLSCPQKMASRMQSCCTIGRAVFVTAEFTLMTFLREGQRVPRGK